MLLAQIFLRLLSSAPHHYHSLHYSAFCCIELPWITATCTAHVAPHYLSIAVQLSFDRSAIILHYLLIAVQCSVISCFIQLRTRSRKVWPVRVLINKNLWYLNIELLLVWILIKSPAVFSGWTHQLNAGWDRLGGTGGCCCSLREIRIGKSFLFNYLTLFNNLTFGFPDMKWDTQHWQNRTSVEMAIFWKVTKFRCIEKHVTGVRLLPGTLYV